MRMVPLFPLLAAGLAALALAGCKGDEPGGTGETTPSTTGANASGHWAMPNLVGLKLQAAQNQIQALTGNPLFLTLSHDATGKGRNQILDSNWKVCSQNVAPGTPFTKDTKIDFATVKQEEACP